MTGKQSSKCPVKQKKWALIALLLTVVIGGIGGWVWHLNQAGPLQKEITLVIKQGSGVQKIAHKLASNGVISNPRFFRLAVWSRGKSGALRAGEYTFAPQTSLKEVINKLSNGITLLRTVMIPEGLTVEEIMTRLQALPLTVTEEDLGEIPEGTLYPDTYDYHYGLALHKLVERMQTRMEKELQDAWELRVTDLPLASPNELLILASIVEKETAKTEERARIAGVFVNRLNRGMKLQSDPTVIYGASDYHGNVTRQHLQEDQPYNTYVIKGLPPTPISNPGREALIATAQPESHNYLYFVADGTGGHVFSRNYEEHLQNVQNYLKVYRQQHGK